MAMATYLQKVTADQIAALKSNPSSINDLNEDGFTTYFPGLINYALTGTAWPAGDHPLDGVVYGNSSVETSTLENAAFGVVSPEEAVEMLASLKAVDIESKRGLIPEESFYEVIEEEELDELEVIAPSEIDETLVGELEGLIQFYEEIAEAELGMVTYTT